MKVIHVTNRVQGQKPFTWLGNLVNMDGPFFSVGQNFSSTPVRFPVLLVTNKPVFFIAI